MTLMCPTGPIPFTKVHDKFNKFVVSMSIDWCTATIFVINSNPNGNLMKAQL